VDRRRRILAGIDVATAKGLEVGPLHQPIVGRPGAPVSYIDHAGTQALRAKYAGDPAVDPAAIVDVDFVWGDRPLAEAVGEAAPFDYVVASHVIEHVPDLVGWLDEIAEVLGDGGVLSLAIPDKRYCFDARRGLTGIADVVEAHLLASRRPPLRAVFDFWSRIVAVDTAAVWAGERGYDDVEDRLEEAFERTRVSAGSDAYADVHVSTFTPDSFGAILHALARLDLLAFTVRAMSATAPGELEFFVMLEKLPAALAPEARRERQLASLPSPSPPTLAAGTAGRTTRFVASPREERALMAKRRLIEGLRRLVPHSRTP